MKINTREDALALIEEMQNTKFDKGEPCMAFTGLKNESVYNVFIFNEDDKLVVKLMDFEHEDLIQLDIVDLAAYFLENQEDINSMLESHAILEFKEKVKKRKHLQRIK